MLSRTLILSGGLVALGAAFLVPSASADPFLPVPPASFLDYHVSTARGLSEEVAADVVVRARLARHFGLSEPSVVAYVRRNLVETTLTASQAGRYRVACISPSGREYWVSERLAAGTPVFALATTGKPILKLECGNPLVSSLPILQAKKSHPVTAPLMASDPTAVPGQTMVASAMLPEDETFTAVPDLTGYQFDGVGPVTNVGGFEQVLTRGGGLNFLPGLIGAAALFGVTSGHGASPQIVPVPAPEPSPNSKPSRRRRRPYSRPRSSSRLSPPHRPRCGRQRPRVSRRTGTA